MYRRYANPEQAREARRADSRAYNRANRTANRLRYVWNTYRLPAARYREMLATGCGICGAADPTDVDHLHGCDHPDRGVECCERCVRGLLCRSCNLRVGAYERSQNSQPDVAAYLAVEGSVTVDQMMLF